MEKVKKEMRSFAKTMKKIKEEYEAKDPETSNKESPLADEDFGGNVDMVDLQQLINKILTGQPYIWLSTISVVGMAGIGKTTIVKAVYNKPVIYDYFDLRAFVRVGHDYLLKYILLDLLVCLFPTYNKNLGIEKSEEDLKRDIRKFVWDRRTLIVLDDVWDRVYFDIFSCLPDNNGSKIIITTRLSGLADGDAHKIPFLNEEESWNLFCRKVFVPPGLEKVGKKIVKKCGGLPLGIISIANILSKVEKTLDYWENVANDENLLALATEEGSHMSESLFLSYKYLPPHLKECCLHFGVFPLNHEISVSKLIKLWVGEGLVEAKHYQTFEDAAREYLEDLVSHSIVLVRQQSSNGRTKTCSAHYFFWHLLVREAANKKIFHLINSYISAFSEGLTSIKVLDALTIRLYKFPIGILELVELKYLAITYDGNLPSSISRLKNLVYLIVHRYHLKIINSSPSYTPIEIWNMQELRHLQVMGSDLPHPVDGAQLPNLLTLLGVSYRSCTKEVLQSTPNLKKLGVRIVLPQGVSETLRIFDHLALLSRLESFKCIMSNPNPRSQQILLFPESVFPSSLTKLTLSGCGFAWKDMSIIGALKYLRVLKLRCYAFQGPEWVVDEKEFQVLEHLLLEDTDLVHWRVGYGCFPWLKRVIIRHCYKLEEIPNELADSIAEVINCSTSIMTTGKHILEEQRECDNEQFNLSITTTL